MKILVILAHPNPASFNAAIARVVIQTLGEHGHEVRFHDLYAEEFDPVLPMGEISQGAVLPPLVAQHVADLTAADGLVIIHPSWWGQPPAILKGWLDRVLRPGVAYQLAGPGGTFAPQGLLGAVAVVVFTTSNTPPLREIDLYGDPLQNIWENCVFRLCGVSRFLRKNFAVIATSNPAVRQAWLTEVAQIIKGYFSG